MTVLMILMCAFALQADRILPQSPEELTAQSPRELNAANPERTAVAAAGVPRQGKKLAGDLSGDAGQEVKKPATVELPSPDTYLAQWPRFRGPTGSGVPPLPIFRRSGTWR